MRRKCILGLSLLLTLTLVACGGSSEPTNVSKDDAKIKELKGNETTAVYIGDEMYQLYEPFSQFLENDEWVFQSGDNIYTTQDKLADIILYSETYETIYLEGDVGDLEVIIANKDKGTPVTEAEVISIKLELNEDKKETDKDIFVLANGINQTTTSQEINSISNDLGLNENKNTSLNDGTCEVSFVFAADGEKIANFTVADTKYIEDNNLEEYELHYSGTDKEKILERSDVIEGTVSGQVEITSTSFSSSSSNSTKETLFTATTADGTQFIIGKNQEGFTNFPDLKEGDQVKIYYTNSESVFFDNFSSSMKLVYSSIIYVNDVEYFCFK